MMNSNSGQIRVALADDHRLILQGIKEVLESEPDINIVAIASNGKELVEKLELHEIDIALSDIDMPGLSGLELLEQRMQYNFKSDTRIIILSVHDELSVIQKAMKLGAYGYLLKKSDPEMIVDAIRTVAKGRKYFDSEVMEISIRPAEEKEHTSAPNPDEKSLELVAQLTLREKEIIRLVVEGMSNHEIGEVLFISKRTVDTHRNNLMAKLGLKNTVQLVKFALKNGLAE